MAGSCSHPRAKGTQGGGGVYQRASCRSRTQEPGCQEWGLLCEGLLGWCWHCRGDVTTAERLVRSWWRYCGYQLLPLLPPGLTQCSLGLNWSRLESLQNLAALSIAGERSLEQTGVSPALRPPAISTKTVVYPQIYIKPHHCTSCTWKLIQAALANLPYLNKVNLPPALIAHHDTL